MPLGQTEEGHEAILLVPRALGLPQRRLGKPMRGNALVGSVWERKPGNCFAEGLLWPKQLGLLWGFEEIVSLLLQLGVTPPPLLRVIIEKSSSSHRSSAVPGEHQCRQSTVPMYSVPSLHGAPGAPVGRGEHGGWL